MQLRLVVALPTVVSERQRLRSAVSPSSTCPTFPYASASRPRKYGGEFLILSRQAARPWRSWAIPAALSCAANAHPLHRSSRQPLRKPLLS